jgi:hypothetical protein
VWDQIILSRRASLTMQQEHVLMLVPAVVSFTLPTAMAMLVAPLHLPSRWRERALWSDCSQCRQHC